MINPIKLSPFKRFCVTIGNLPTTYMESLSYYEMLEWLCNYLEKTVIPAINNNSEALEEVQNAFVELKNYVDTYFDNIDLQDEVNAKLDDMADKGQLTEIIAQYLGLAGIFGYDTVSDIEGAENITNGSIARCLGKEEYNDGKGAFYKIRNIKNTDVVDGDNIIAITYDNNLVGEKIPDYEINLLKEKTKYITPEMFGAKGDGETDDTESLLAMIEYINDNVPTEPSEYQNKDWSYISIKFNGVYAVSEPITITSSYGAKICNLHLIATDDFTGDYLIGFDGATREITIENCIFNGNLSVNKCLLIDDYTLVFRIVNTHITRFKEYGLYANDDKGHEIMMSKCKINQVEWAEREDLPTLVSAGTGVYIGTQRYDNYFNESVINYCRDYDLVVKGGSNWFTNIHFYWSDVNIDGYYNYINGCYFDGSELLTKGINYIDNNYFGSDDGDPFIKITESYNDYWKTDLMRISNNVFHNKGADGSILASIDFDSSWTGHTDMFKAETIGNNFNKCPAFLFRGNNIYYPEQWKTNLWTGNQTFGNSGSVRIGDLLIQYGTISSSGYITFPIEYELAPFFVNITNNGAQSSTPWAGDISTTRFYANGVSTTSTWFAIGRINA